MKSVILLSLKLLTLILRWDFNQRELEKCQKLHWTKIEYNLLKVLKYSLADSVHILRLLCLHKLFRMNTSLITNNFSSLITDSHAYLNNPSWIMVKLTMLTNAKRNNKPKPKTSVIGIIHYRFTFIIIKQWNRKRKLWSRLDQMPATALLTVMWLLNNWQSVTKLLRLFIFRN